MRTASRTSLDANLFIHSNMEEKRPLVTSSPTTPTPLSFEFEHLTQEQKPTKGFWQTCKQSFQQFLNIAGPGFVIAIGYLDPGNYQGKHLLFFFGKNNSS